AAVLDAGVERVRAGGQAAVQQVEAQVAEVGLACRAPPAVPADRQDRADHVVAGSQASDAGADLLDDPGALVAADDREPRHDVAVPEMLVGVAQSRGNVPDQDLARLRRIQVELGDLEVLACSAQNRGSRLHGPSLARCNGNQTARNRRAIPRAILSWPGLTKLVPHYTPAWRRACLAVDSSTVRRQSSARPRRPAAGPRPGQRQ